jgi:hypothetical protein
VSVETSNVVPFADDTKARRLTNLENAKLLIKSGLYIFVSSGKTPLIPRFNKIDTQLTQDEREKAIEGYETKHGEPPIHVGATNDPAVVTKMFKRHMDAVWSIACGPSKLVVIDADSKDNGPELIGKHFEEHGLPEGCIVVPTQSGGRHYIFKDPDGKFTNAAGALKKQYGCDVRGVGGQYIAPGSIREDGKTYGTKADARAFRTAYRDGTLPELPDHVATLIGTGGEASQKVDDADISHVIRELEDTDWSEPADLFDPTIGTYDLESLKESNAEFAELYANPTGDHSEDRWAISQHLMQHFKMSVCDLAVFYEYWEGAGTLTDDGKGSGNYRLRDIAREWYKNKDRYVSNGEAMGAVVDPDERDQSSRSYVRDSDVVANYRPIRWLVKRLIPLNSVGAIYGLPNVGKSFVVFDLANHARRGRDWFGRKVKGGDVLYIYAEGAEGIAGRAKAWADSNDASGGNIALMNGVPNLFSDKKAPEKIIAAARECAAESGQPVRLIIVDTLAAATTGADGSSDRDMGLVCDRLRKVANELGCAVLVVHHSGKDVSKGMRGSSATLGAFDFTLLAEETKGASTISVEKMRDARKGQTIKFKLVEVVIGVDEDGEDVTSCVVRAVEAGAALSAVEEDEEVPLIKVPDRREDRVAMLLEVAREEAGRLAAEEEPLGEIGLTVPSLVEAVNVRRGGLCGLDGQPLAPLNRKAVWRVVETAVEAGQMETRSSKAFLRA